MCVVIMTGGNKYSKYEYNYYNEPRPVCVETIGCGSTFKHQNVYPKYCRNSVLCTSTR